MTSHKCSACGAITACPNRSVGGGRRHKAGWRTGRNHSKVWLGVAALRTVTCDSLREWLNAQVSGSSARPSDWDHVGWSGPLWEQHDVQTPVSDLVGAGLLTMAAGTYFERLRYSIPEAVTIETVRGYVAS